MKDKKMSLPSEDQLLRELEKEQYKQSYRRILRSTVFSLITLAAIVVLVVMLFMPVMRIYGTSMEPTLEEGEIVAAFKGSEFRRGDIVAFYYGNKLLVKRYIAGPATGSIWMKTGTFSSTVNIWRNPILRRRR